MHQESGLGIIIQCYEKYNRNNSILLIGHFLTVIHHHNPWHVDKLIKIERQLHSLQLNSKDKKKNVQQSNAR